MSSSKRQPTLISYPRNHGRQADVEKMHPNPCARVFFFFIASKPSYHISLCRIRYNVLYSTTINQSRQTSKHSPITPTIPALGKLNSKSSINNLSPNDFLTPCTSMTTSPSRGPGGM
mmetsp:Transcript_12237/g.25295  ORF Transcript_12237/g.25295 Transcript_12237/m.25295 type:complete len:117 (+) Transcript_12237:813-1163(+)